LELIYKTENGRLFHGDNIEVMKKIKDNTVDSCISDFPYDLSFMGKKWDSAGNFYEWCKGRVEPLYRIIKPGGYVCIFGHPKN
jgi:site-specific DNA-methyltransferase (adenine-specific)